MTIAERNRVIEDLYLLRIPEKVWRYSDKEALKDFSQYCYLLLFELADDRIQSLVEEGSLANYFYTVCRRQAQQSSSFWKTYDYRFETINLDESDNSNT